MPIVVTSGLSASVLVASWEGIPLCKDQLTPVQVWPWDPGADLRCFAEVMKVSFDPDTNSFKNRNGVTTVQTVDFGGLQGLTFGRTYIGQMEPFGYKEKINMWGAPFDWRHPPQAMGDWFANMTSLIETAFEYSKGKKVTIVSPSYGPEVTLQFLQSVSSSWKDKYISWFIADSPVWSGTTVPLFVLTSGLSSVPVAAEAEEVTASSRPRLPTSSKLQDQFSFSDPLLELIMASSATSAAGTGAAIEAGGQGIPGDLFKRFFRGFLQQIPSVIGLSPVFKPEGGAYEWNSSETVMFTPHKNYSASTADVTQMFKDIGADKRLNPVYSYTMGHSSALSAFAAPLVNTFVNYGFDIPTAAAYIYDKDFGRFAVPNVTSYVLDSGDQIVPLRSSIRSLEWESAQKAAGKLLVHAGFSKLDHAGCLIKGNECFEIVMRLLLNGTVPPPSSP